MSRILQLTVPQGAGKIRLDKFLSQNLENSGTKAEAAQEEASEDNVEEELCTDEAACSKASSGISREGIKRLIAKGLCLVNGRACTSASQKLKTGDTVEIELANEESGLVPEEGEVTILHEDADVLVCAKEAGLTVHPCPSCPSNTLIGRLYSRYPELGAMGGLRPGIVHRLDKETSGLLVVARNERARLFLTKAFAERKVRKIYLAIVAGKAPVNACAPAGAENHAAIAAIMGAAAPTGERKVAFVRCNGGVNAVKRYEYIGVKDCISATKVAAGPLECQFGCLGFGSCVAACQFGAMSIGPNGAAVVDPDKCTDCMACAKACPRHLITEVPVSKKVHVACANQDKGKAAMSVCSHSCIGCGLCQKECKKDAIHVVNGVAVIDYDKCVGCKLCTKVCPRDAILPIATAEEKEKYKAIKKAQAEKAAAAKAAETAGAAQ